MSIPSLNRRSRLRLPDYRLNCLHLMSMSPFFFLFFFALVSFLVRPPVSILSYRLIHRSIYWLLLKPYSFPQSLPHSPSIKAYVCGHTSCYNILTQTSTVCFSTSGELSDHHKTHHYSDPCGEDDKPFKCGMGKGCQKGWKVCCGLHSDSLLY